MLSSYVAQTREGRTAKVPLLVGTNKVRLRKTQDMHHSFKLLNAGRGYFDRRRRAYCLSLRYRRLQVRYNHYTNVQSVVSLYEFAFP